MERLTDKKEADAQRREYENRLKNGYPRNIPEERFLKLAAYEDTGLEPDEITTEPYGCVFYCNRNCNLEGDWCAEGPGCQQELNAEAAKHLLELAQAEKDGRLVVLPCKPGQIIYRKCWIKVGVAAVDAPGIEWIYKNRELFGKEFFLTREEAEAALEGTTA